MAKLSVDLRALARQGARIEAATIVARLNLLRELFPGIETEGETTVRRRRRRRRTPAAAITNGAGPTPRRQGRQDPLRRAATMARP
jgi:hypothetical protein